MFDVAEEFQEEKRKTQRQRHRKSADHHKTELGKNRIKLPAATKASFDMRRVKRLSDLPEE